MHRRAQAAMEFLMTYGWAILVVLVVIGALAYFGVISPSSLLPEKCTFPVQLSCSDFVVSDVGSMIVVQNGAGRDMIIESLAIEGENIYGTCAQQLNLNVRNREKAELFVASPIECAFSESGRSKQHYDLVVTYRFGASDVSHELRGELFAGSDAQGGSIATVNAVFPFDSNTNPEPDVSPSAYSASLNGVTYEGSDCHSNGCYRFGLGESMTLTPSVIIPGEFAIAFWFNRDNSDFHHSFTGNSADILPNERSKIALLDQANSNVLRVRVLEGPVYTQPDIGYSSALNGQWNFLVVQRTKDNIIQASLNGGPLVSGLTPLPGDFTVDTLGNNGDNQPLYGKLDDVVIFNRALTQEDIMMLYNG